MLRGVERSGAASRNAASYGGELETWLTSMQAHCFAFCSPCQEFYVLPGPPDSFPWPLLRRYCAAILLAGFLHLLIQYFLGAFRMCASSFTRILFLCSALLGASIAFTQTPSPSPAQKPTPKSPAKPAAADAPIPSPVSRHYPILIVAHGNEPSWSLRLGMKGPERLDRAGYPPIVLDPDEIVPDEPGVSWVYHAKDEVTSADVAVELSRESCSDGKSDLKYNFKVELQHAQIGLLNGCGQSAPEKFPEFRKKNQLDPDDNSGRLS